uniref:Uncharacterized protein n=1 Tax=Candidatus Kentrum sp. DK TaxID=2126562 RepID=A0A450TE50_9GAMM|nr:MAG: hypothetical protein BECKDK2373C_GA0170839_11282 [Candidatus Kentron sp. DK]
MCNLPARLVELDTAFDYSYLSDSWRITDIPINGKMYYLPMK